MKSRYSERICESIGIEFQPARLHYRLAISRGKGDAKFIHKWKSSEDILEIGMVYLTEEHLDGFPAYS